MITSLELIGLMVCIPIVGCVAFASATDIRPDAPAWQLRAWSSKMSDRVIFILKNVTAAIRAAFAVKAENSESS